ncbi:putative ABC transporter ATP-binding protein [Micrococcus luteus Mu201]|nr:putative ABC transporter ATP-binding protein [Micrococcus luteus Mu201]
MLSIRHVSKHYGGVPAVQDVSFDVPAGRITGFVGPNGAGKSTVLRMALGLTRPDAGEVTVDGAPFADAAAPGRTVGALLSAESLPGHMTVRGHLGWAAATQGLPHRRVREVLEAVGLPHAGRRRIKGLSLGMRQRVGRGEGEGGVRVHGDDARVRRVAGGRGVRMVPGATTVGTSVRPGADRTGLPAWRTRQCSSSESRAEEPTHGAPDPASGPFSAAAGGRSRSC